MTKRSDLPRSASSIECRSATVTFASGVSAVRDVSLQLPAGQIHALIGPSGCGKTTLLRAMAGLQNCTDGQVNLEPPAISSQGEIGFVFQQPALLPWLTTIENVMLPLDLLGQGSPGMRRQRAAAILDNVKLSDAADRMPNQLSGGMKMRVSIARALITQPSVLLLDEPFAALDDMLRERLGELFLSLWNEFRFTAVLVTHNIAESILLSHHIVVMGNATADVPIVNPLPWPRDVTMRRSPQFGEFYGAISDRLRSASEQDHEVRL